ncbi:MAG: tryptophan synthase subunit alpha [Pirellulales bacterium]|nr:tryptophan synthase subunit alpha [Pirellulales bacterium]
MSSIDLLFQRLRTAGKKAFMPFITAGDPDLDFTEAVIGELAGRGCDLFELGIPYSDPIADGPVIQASYNRALEKKIKLADILERIGKITGGTGCQPVLPAPPIVTMASYAVVYRHGLEKYVADAQAAGAAGAIVPDLPVEEAAPLAAICRKADFSLIQLITPTTPRDRAKRIAEQTTGFIYYVSITGITGERESLPPQILDDVAWLRQQTPLPVCIGFGISRPEHVRMLAPVADGLIVGSAIVRRMAEAAVKPRRQVLDEIGRFVASLRAALE